MEDVRSPPAGEAEQHAPPRRRMAARRHDPFPEIFAGRRRRGLFILIAAGIGQGAVWAGISLMMKTAFDGFFTGARPPGGDAGGALLFAALAACALAAGLLRWLAHVEAERVGQSYAHAMRMRLFRQLIEAGGTRRSRRGSVLLRLTSDMTPIRQWVSLGLSQLIVSTLTIVLAIAALAFVDLRIAAAIAATLALAAAVSILLSRGLGGATAAARLSRGRLANAAGDSAVKPSATDARKARRKLRKLSRQVRNSLMERALYAGAMRAVATSGGAMMGIAALGVGLVATSGEPISPGALMSAVFISGALAPYANDASRCLEYWTAAVVAREKQLELFRRLAKGEMAPPGDGDDGE